MDYQLIRSKRKTLSLQINRNAQLIVRAPHRLPIQQIEVFIQNKSNWIKQKTQALQNQIIKKPDYLTGEKFLYLGNRYPLIRQTTLNNRLVFDGKVFKLSHNSDAASEFYRWYKSAFKKIALPRLDYYSDLYQLKYNKIHLKKQKTLWGSCSSTNNINLNYLLTGAPMSAIDYVIVHELSHIKHKNHSQDFWNLVQSILPDYKTARKWLKDNGHQLHNL